VPDRAGGHADAAGRTLTLAQPNLDAPPAPLLAWADQVEKASHGSLHIAFRNGWRSGQRQFEQGTVEDVRNGRTDMGEVGARVFDRLGDDDFQAMLAPFLVDSLRLESRVFQAGIPGQMLKGVRSLGLVGVGVVPGPLRRVLARSAPIKTAAAFQGKTIAMQDSALTAETLRTLGAEPVAVPTSAHLGHVDGYEQQVASVFGNGYQTSFHYLTTNANLWPKPFVVFMRRAVFDSLSPDQRNAVLSPDRTASPDTIESAIETDEGHAVRGLCQAGLTFVTATPADLAGLKRAVQPIYARLRRDRRTAGWLARIVRLKAELAARPDELSCPTSGRQPQGGGLEIPLGTYTRTIEPADFRALGLKPVDAPFGRWTLELDTGGVLKIRAPDDRRPEDWSYELFNGKIRVSGPPATFVADVSYHDARLRFDVLRFTDCGGTPGNGDCMVDPHRPDHQGGYEVVLGGVPKPWIKQR
jgi:TRAP-type C4-dicarboxylate transport system substrate-binding protein